MNPLKSVSGTIISGVVLALVIVFFLPGEHVVDITPDDRGDLWIATDSTGLGRLDLRTNTFR